MRTISMGTAALLLSLAMGCDEAGSGACEKTFDATYVSAEWCQEFYNESGEDGRTGEEICNEVGGDWTAGRSCPGIGYDFECNDNEFYADPC